MLWHDGGTQPKERHMLAPNHTTTPFPETSKGTIEYIFGDSADDHLSGSQLQPVGTFGPIVYYTDATAQRYHTAARYQVGPIHFKRLQKMAPAVDTHTLEALASAPARLD
jgi:hypothetical protein